MSTSRLLMIILMSGTVAACSAPDIYGSKGVKPTFSFPVTNNDTPYTRCLADLAQVPGDHLPVISVGEVADKTGQREGLAESAVISQGISEMVMSAFYKTGKTRIRCSAVRESGSCTNRRIIYLPAVEGVVIEEHSVLGMGVYIGQSTPIFNRATGEISYGRVPTGSVVLVGAGPGDPGLLTLKGLRALNEADVILHDRLVSAEVLDLARRDAEFIEVGKEAGAHAVPQERIHELLLEHARAGKRVVRLKGGDPFVFGRGGEELEALRAKGIPYEVVPGITGLWQIKGRGTMTFDERLRLDIEYIERRSTLLDLRLIAETALAVFKGSGV